MYTIELNIQIYQTKSQSYKINQSYKFKKSQN